MMVMMVVIVIVPAAAVVAVGMRVPVVGVRGVVLMVCCAFVRHEYSCPSKECDPRPLVTSAL